MRVAVLQCALHASVKIARRIGGLPGYQHRYYKTVQILLPR